MNEIVTLSRNSPEFEKYLRGTFSNTHRALPIKSLNVNTQAEVVSFSIVPKESIQRPSLLVIFLKAIRVRRFLFILFPLFYVLFEELRNQSLKDPWILFSSTAGLIFLYAAIQMRNDYHDHLNGLDRISTETVSPAIQKGWITAESVRKISWIFAASSFLFSLPVLLVFPKILLIMLAASVLIFWSLFRGHSSFKNSPVGELAFGILVGPLLALGYDISISGQMTWKVFGFGCVWGMFVLFRLHLQNFENLMTSSQAKIKSIINHYGFDGSKKLIIWWWFASVLGFLIFQAMTTNFLIWSGSAVIMTWMSRIFVRKVNQLASPVGSQMNEAQKEGVQLFNLLVLLWSTQILFTYFISGMFSFFIQGL